jgi:hypothetical protein
VEGGGGSGDGKTKSAVAVRAALAAPVAPVAREEAVQAVAAFSTSGQAGSGTRATAEREKRKGVRTRVDERRRDDALMAWLNSRDNRHAKESIKTENGSGDVTSRKSVDNAIDVLGAVCGALVNEIL